MAWRLGGADPLGNLQQTTLQHTFPVQQPAQLHGPAPTTNSLTKGYAPVPSVLTGRRFYLDVSPAVAVAAVASLRRNLMLQEAIVDDFFDVGKTQFVVTDLDPVVLRRSAESTEFRASTTSPLMGSPVHESSNQGDTSSLRSSQPSTATSHNTLSITSRRSGMGQRQLNAAKTAANVNTPSEPVVFLCLRHGIPLVNYDQLRDYVRSRRAQVLTSALPVKRNAGVRNLDAKPTTFSEVPHQLTLGSEGVRPLVGFYVKLEDRSFQFRVTVKEWVLTEIHPRLHLDVPSFDSPFFAPKLGQATDVRPQRKPSAKSRKDKQMRSTIKPGMDAVLVPVKKFNMKPGYCECCKISYENMTEHRKTERHLQFEANDENFREVDSLCAEVNLYDMTRFFQSTNAMTSAPPLPMLPVNATSKQAPQADLTVASIEEGDVMKLAELKPDLMQGEDDGIDLLKFPADFDPPRFVVAPSPVDWDHAVVSTQKLTKHELSSSDGKSLLTNSSRTPKRLVANEQSDSAKTPMPSKFMETPVRPSKQPLREIEDSSNIPDDLCSPSHSRFTSYTRPHVAEQLQQLLPVKRPREVIEEGDDDLRSNKRVAFDDAVLVSVTPISFTPTVSEPVLRKCENVNEAPSDSFTTPLSKKARTGEQTFKITVTPKQVSGQKSSHALFTGMSSKNNSNTCSSPGVFHRKLPAHTSEASRVFDFHEETEATPSTMLCAPEKGDPFDFTDETVPSATKSTPRVRKTSRKTRMPDASTHQNKPEQSSTGKEKWMPIPPGKRL